MIVKRKTPVSITGMMIATIGGSLGEFIRLEGVVMDCADVCV